MKNLVEKYPDLHFWLHMKSNLSIGVLLVQGIENVLGSSDKSVDELILGFDE